MLIRGKSLKDISKKVANFERGTVQPKEKKGSAKL